MATALVSEPPRPRVVMRPSRVDALEAGDHRAPRRRPWRRAASRAGCRRCGRGRGASSAMIGTCQPMPGARRHAHVAQGHRQQAGGHLLAGGHHHVVLVVGRRRGPGPPRRSRRSRPPARWSCRPWPRPPRRPGGRACTSALHQPRDAADALQVGHRGAAEFHHQPGHGRRGRSCSCAAEGGPSSGAAVALQCLKPSFRRAGGYGRA